MRTSQLSAHLMRENKVQAGAGGEHPPATISDKLQTHFELYTHVQSLAELQEAGALLASLSCYKEHPAPRHEKSGCSMNNIKFPACDYSEFPHKRLQSVRERQLHKVHYQVYLLSHPRAIALVCCDILLTSCSTAFTSWLPRLLSKL